MNKFRSAILIFSQLALISSSTLADAPKVDDGMDIWIGDQVRHLIRNPDWIRPEPVDVSIGGDMFNPRLRIFAAPSNPVSVNEETIELPETPKLLIIVTNQELIVRSSIFAKYVDWRRAGGWEVIVGTEEDWDQPTDDDGDDRPARIRSWLKHIYSENGRGYLLLIGGPDSQTGVPMRITRPLSAYQESSDMDIVPTDYYYADLESDWDCDGDLIFGEYADDRGPGCADWGPELIVGRIPIYSIVTGYHKLDRVLSKTIEYETMQDKTYRDRVIFAGAFGGFKGSPTPSNDQYTQHWDLADFLYRTSIDLPHANETQNIRMFEDEGVFTSKFEHELPFTHDTLMEQWQLGASTVSWAGHGERTGSVRSVWREDQNHNGLAESNETTYPQFINSDDSSTLNSAPLSIVHMMSCLNGYFEDSQNLGAALLGNGAIATASASRLALGTIEDEWNPSSDKGDATDISYYFTILVQSGASAGEALAYTKWGFSGTDWGEFDAGAYGWLGKFEFNLYGDPTVSLERCTADVQCDDGLPCNGTEQCSDGFCIHINPIQCEDSTCNRGVCNNETGTCELTPVEDGKSCLDELFCTIEEQCISGQCTSTPFECSAPDGMTAYCDEEQKSCQWERIDEDTDQDANYEESDEDCSCNAVGNSKSSGLLSVLGALIF